MTALSGHCLCGAVRFSASEAGNFGVCHCEMCRRNTGSALMAVTIPEAAFDLTGAEHVATRRSSSWASRSWCRECGSPLWYRYDKGVDGAGDYEVAVGLLDDADALVLEREIFIDQKPRSWSLAGDHPRMTRAETLARYGTHVDGA